MNIRWKKTTLYIVFGAIAIFLFLLRYFTGSFSIANIWNPITYSVDESDMVKGANGYVVDNGKYFASIDDAGIIVKVPEYGYIDSVNIIVKLETELQNAAQIYYANANEFDGDYYVENYLYDGQVKFKFDTNKTYDSLRLDLTTCQGEVIEIESVEIIFTNHNKVLLLICSLLFILCYCVATFIYINRNFLAIKLSSSKRWGKHYSLLTQVFSLAISDFQARFSGSYLGVFWGVIQPLSTILLFWFVFQVGFRSNPIEDVPFILWLSAGMIPWNYFYDAWISGTASFTGYGYIVKKVVFKVEVLPFVKAISSAILNLIFNMILLVIYTLYGRFPGIHIFDMLYFSLCIFILTLGLNYFTASLNVFMKDIGQLLGIILQFLMWMTPMMWVYTTIPDKYSFFYELNPLHYIINGYRESLISGFWFFHNYKQMIWFWIVTIVIVVCGHRLMKKLKPHFADVL